MFDVNTPYKHRHVLANNTFIYDTEQVYCVWQNELEEGTGVIAITLDFFAQKKGQEYTRFREAFCERAYGIDKIQFLLEKAGMEYITVYDDMTFVPSTANSERWIVVARKMK